MSTDTTAAYIFSTSTNDVRFVEWTEGDRDGPALPGRSVVVKGGANVPNDHMITPRGIVTPVTSGQLNFLQQNSMFKTLCKDGYYEVSKKNQEITKVITGMQAKDKSAPLESSDFTEPPKMNADRSTSYENQMR